MRKFLIMSCVMFGVGATLGTIQAQDEKPRGEVRSSDAKSVYEAEKELFSGSGEAEFFDGYTSHFNFDNRVLGSNPPTTNKLRCMVECKLDDGRTMWFRVGRVNVGELQVAEVDSARIRVVQCRFWWKLRPLGDWYSSTRVKASADNYIVYAFLVWRGQNDYQQPIDFYEEPLADAKSRAEAAKVAKR